MRGHTFSQQHQGLCAGPRPRGRVTGPLPFPAGRQSLTTRVLWPFPGFADPACGNILSPLSLYCLSPQLALKNMRVALNGHRQPERV